MKIGRQVRDSVLVVMPHVQQAVPNPFRDTSIDRSPDSFIVFERSGPKRSQYSPGLLLDDVVQWQLGFSSCLCAKCAHALMTCAEISVTTARGCFPKVLLAEISALLARRSIFYFATNCLYLKAQTV